MYDGFMATDSPAPDPFDAEIEALLGDPDFVARLDDVHDRLKRGELELHHDDEARKIVGLEREPQTSRVLTSADAG
jgi:hypothetical protein